MSPLYSFIMDIRIKTEKTQIMRRLWEEFFPQTNTPADKVSQVMANRDWLRQSLEFYGWRINPNAGINCDMKYVDGGCIIYIEGDRPCALVTLDESEKELKLKFTYVDNRAQ